METVKNSYCFNCIDYSEDLKKPTIRNMGIRFTNEDDYKKFSEVIEESRQHNNSLEYFKNLIQEDNKKDEKKEDIKEDSKEDKKD